MSEKNYFRTFGENARNRENARNISLIGNYQWMAITYQLVPGYWQLPFTSTRLLAIANGWSFLQGLVTPQSRDLKPHLELYI